MENKFTFPLVSKSVSTSCFEVQFTSDDEYSIINCNDMKHVLSRNELISENLCSTEFQSSFEVDFTSDYEYSINVKHKKWSCICKFMFERNPHQV